jgi:hypothetical protein
MEVCIWIWVLQPEDDDNIRKFQREPDAVRFDVEGTNFNLESKPGYCECETWISTHCEM